VLAGRAGRFKVQGVFATRCCMDAHQIPRSDQNKMRDQEDPRGIATGGSILTDIKKVVITENAMVLGMSGECHIERLLAKVRK
jgi:hypothetical protein